MVNNQISQLNQQIVNCSKCPRLVAWREKIASEKVKRFAEQPYWGKPVPGFGDANAKLLIVGLAPAAHGANRTGRMFTGDRSGDWLYRSLYKFGFANQAGGVSRADGLKLTDCYITATLHCAPPLNKPTTDEKANCFPFFNKELVLLSNAIVYITLGKLAFDTVIKALRMNNNFFPEGKLVFGHGRLFRVNAKQILIASYHPSQQNTFTGKLTEPMFDSVFKQAQEVIQNAKLII